MDRLSELAARADIQDSLGRYARGVDRRDWAAVRACYHADATDEHGEFSGTVEEFIAWVTVRHTAIPFSMHFLGNCLIDFHDETTAFVETYFIAMQRRSMRNGSEDGDETHELDSEVIGRYLDRFECRDGEWKVAKRCVVYDSSRLVPSSHRPRNGRGALGTRTPLDPVFTWFDGANASP